MDRNCQLRDFVDSHPDLNYNDSTLFYFQFTNKAEMISEGQEVILMNKVQIIILCYYVTWDHPTFQDESLFRGPAVNKLVGVPGAPGVKVNNPCLKYYQVFIQNAGSGTRFLKAKSYLLYKKECVYEAMD